MPEGNGEDPGGGNAKPARRDAPLLIVAELPPDVLAWADGLRRQHYPPERNRLKAHVTLFHALPPSALDEVRRMLAELVAATPPPAARIAGLMAMEGGTALAVDSAPMVALHDEIAGRLHGLLMRQDQRPLRLHITVQNKVPAQEARALQAALAPVLASGAPGTRGYRFRGLGLYSWHDGLWNPIREFVFRG